MHNFKRQDKCPHACLHLSVLSALRREHVSVRRLPPLGRPCYGIYCMRSPQAKLTWSVMVFPAGAELTGHLTDNCRQRQNDRSYQQRVFLVISLDLFLFFKSRSLIKKYEPSPSTGEQPTSYVCTLTDFGLIMFLKSTCKKAGRKIMG